MSTFPVEIAYRSITPSDSLEAFVHRKIERLARLDAQITHCRVVLEEPHRHQHKGRQFAVHIDLHLPGEPIVITHDPGRAEDHEDMYTTIRDAFQAAQRRVNDRIERRRDLKRH